MTNNNNKEERNSYEYTAVLTEQALQVRNYSLYKQLVSVFYQHDKSFSSYFNMSYLDKLKEFIYFHKDELYSYGFDFNVEDDYRYGVYSSGILVAYFDLEYGFEIFIDENIQNLINFNKKKERIKIEINTLKDTHSDITALLYNPNLFYQNDMDYLLINNPFKANNKKDYLKIIKKETLLVENYLNHLNDLIELNQRVLESFEKRFKNLNDFSYALGDLEHRRNLLYEMIDMYAFKVNKEKVKMTIVDNDIDISFF